MEEIKGYRFDFNKKIYLNSPKSKFWEVTISDADVTYRAGVLRGEEEHKIKEVSKNYDTNTLAKATVITKIAGKIQKGYFSTSAEKVQQEEKPVKRRKGKEKPCDTEDTEQNMKETRKRQSKSKQKTANQEETGKKFWKGMEKDDQIVEFEVTGSELILKQKKEENIRSETKNFSSFDQSIDYVHRQINHYTAEGFKPMRSSAFLQQESRTRKKPGVPPNPLSNQHSLTSMTDNAMWLNSGQANEDQQDNIYLPNHRLGPPIDHCIKCLLAQNYKEETDPIGWIMSEKLDGVRCLWTGNEMYSRNGNKFNFPNFFTKNWPNSQLDGELFIGRGKFSQTLSAVKKNVPIHSEWATLKYLVFDAPGLKEPFEKRIKILQEELSKIDNPFIKCHAHRPCQGFPDLFIELQRVNKAEGEGIMLRDPSALYENKRSKNLQKVKTFHDDQAEVIGYTAGTGRCLGWVGSLRVRNGKNVEFQVGSGLNDQLRKNPPALRTIITYKYQQFNKQSGKPRFPTFLRVHTTI